MIDYILIYVPNWPDFVCCVAVEMPQEILMENWWRKLPLVIGQLKVMADDLHCALIFDILDLLQQKVRTLDILYEHYL